MNKGVVFLSFFFLTACASSSMAIYGLGISCQANSYNVSTSGVQGCCGTYEYTPGTCVPGNSNSHSKVYNYAYNTSDANNTDTSTSDAVTNDFNYNHDSSTSYSIASTSTAYFSAQCVSTTAGGQSKVPRSVSVGCEQYDELSPAVKCFVNTGSSKTNVEWSCQNTNSSGEGGLYVYVDAVDCTGDLPVNSGDTVMYWNECMGASTPTSGTSLNAS